MKGCAEREKMFSGKVLRFDTPDNFVDGLITNQIIVIIK